MFTGWNKDFGTTNLISTIFLWDGFGFNLTQVGTTLWLSQTHGARPATFYQGWHMVAFCSGCRIAWWYSYSHRQPWIHGKCPVAVPIIHFWWGWQTLAYLSHQILRKRYGLIPSFNEHIISFFKSLWRRDHTLSKWQPQHRLIGTVASTHCYNNPQNSQASYPRFQDRHFHPHFKVL